MEAGISSRQGYYARNLFLIPKRVSQIYCNKSFTSAKAIDELGYSITPFTMALQRTIHSLKIEIYAKQSLIPWLPGPVKDLVKRLHLNAQAGI